MILAVDIGNTNTTCGLFAKSDIKARFHLKSDLNLSADELAAKVKGILELFELSLHDIEHVLLASVVPPLLSLWQEMTRKFIGCEPHIPVPENLGIPILLRHPSEVGIDRILNALAGWKKYRTNLIIVDYGTATTFDCISEKGEYLGGAIAPGILLAAESLFQKTSLLPRIRPLDPPREVIGKDTISALKSGLLYGFAALTDGLIARMAHEFEKKPRIIATGGLAFLMQNLSFQIEKVEPDLTLEGLIFWFEGAKDGGATSS